MTHSEQVILVTGAGSGIGRAIALSLARAGHRVYASMRDARRKNSERADALLQLSREENLSLDIVELDVLSEVGCQAAVNHILAEHGQLDVVVNNAGMLMTGVTRDTLERPTIGLLLISSGRLVALTSTKTVCLGLNM